MAVATEPDTARRRDRYVTVTCPSCQTAREITARQHRRNTSEGKTPLCGLCASHQHRDVEPTQDDYWFWLEVFGVTRVAGMTAQAFVEAHGMPEGLDDICEGFRASRR
jgi:hypothetical protein